MATGNFTFTPDERDAIFALKKLGRRTREIADALGVDIRRVQDCIRHKQRKDEDLKANLTAPHPIQDGRMEPKARKCLGECGREFVSSHAGNRVCPECRRSQLKSIEILYA